MIDAPDQFARAFAAAFGAQDAHAIAAMLMPAAGMLTLTGQWANTPDEAQLLLEAEFAGALGRARLVTGRVALTAVGSDVVVVHQRYVVTGAVDAEGRELPRIAAILAATIAITPEGWRAASLCLSPLS